MVDGDYVIRKSESAAGAFGLAGAWPAALNSQVCGRHAARNNKALPSCRRVFSHHTFSSVQVRQQRNAAPRWEVP